MVFALIGNQNCGKTTLFNCLTGSNQHVGNFPGVTVDQKYGELKSCREHQVVDLPGIYSLRPYTSEEIVTRDFIFNQKPDGIINIVDATNIERNLYLTLQLLELEIPMVIVLNMMDEVRGNGGTVDVSGLSARLSVPVIPISAAKNEGIGDVVDSIISVSKNKIKPKKIDFCPEGAVHRCIHAVSHLIEDHAQAIGVSRRFCATRVIEGDPKFCDMLELNQNELDMIEHSITEMERESGLDRNAALADMRYNFIEDVCTRTVVKCKESREHKRSVAIDRVLTNKYAAIPLFILIMMFIFALTFLWLGAWLSGLLETGISALGSAVCSGFTSFGLNSHIVDFIENGVFGGLGAVVSLLPYIVILFACLSLLEDSGYMARAAFIMDKPLRHIGLSGRSFVPIIIGFGCSVPAVMATRTLSSERDRKMTIMLIPFISCSAKVVVYSAIVKYFGGGFISLMVIFLLYLFGILMGIVTALVANRTMFRGNPVPFVMELPNYRLPTLKSVALLLWEKASDFMKKAFSVIFIATVIIWLLKSYDVRLNYIDTASGGDFGDSILCRFASLILPVFRPVGIKSAALIAALVAGFSAKEAVIGTLGMMSSDYMTLFGSGAEVLAFLVFVLIYTPCVAAIATVRRELGSRKKALAVSAFQCIFAWVCALIVYRTALIFIA